MQRIATESPIQISFRRGFTIVELLIVIVVIAILAAIVVVAYNGVTKQAYETSLKSDLRNASTQLELYNTMGSGYPASLSLANDGEGIPSSDGTEYSYDYDLASNSYCLSSTS